MRLVPGPAARARYLDDLIDANSGAIRWCLFGWPGATFAAPGSSDRSARDAGAMIGLWTTAPGASAPVTPTRCPRPLRTPTTGTRLLWPWLDAVERLGVPRHALLLARALTGRVDARDGTVSTEREIRPGAPLPGTQFTQRRALITLVEAGLLVPASPGRHRLVVPPSADPPRGQDGA